MIVIDDKDCEITKIIKRIKELRISAIVGMVCGFMVLTSGIIAYLKGAQITGIIVMVIALLTIGTNVYLWYDTNKTIKKYDNKK